MYKVFIVEDEQIIREGLRDNIPWEQYGFTFAGEASDGEIALPQIRAVKPDVLITDIRMPFMDGLSLSRVVRGEFPAMHIIILSGYDDFEYARKAIEIGVEKYLTKPVTRRAVSSVLSELARKLDQERQKEEDLDGYRAEMQEYEHFKRRRFFEHVFSGSISVEEIYHEAAKLGLDLSGPSYAVMLADVYARAGNENGSRIAQVREDVFRYFLRHPEYLVTEWVNHTLCVVVRGNEHQIAGFLQQAQKNVAQIAAQGGDADYFLCISEITDRFSHLKACYEQAGSMFSGRYLHQEERTLYWEEYSARITQGEGAAKEQAVQDSDRRDQNEDEISHVLKEALDYIDAHYASDSLSLNAVAKAVGVSPGYFSALFSQKMGMTFVEYVTAKRIETAKTLLLGGEYHSAQVAALVGYKDPNYFRSVFKKTVGCTPREFRHRSPQA